MRCNNFSQIGFCQIFFLYLKYLMTSVKNHLFLLHSHYQCLQLLWICTKFSHKFFNIHCIQFFEHNFNMSRVSSFNCYFMLVLYFPSSFSFSIRSINLLGVKVLSKKIEWFKVQVLLLNSFLTSRTNQFRNQSQQMVLVT